MTRVDEALDVAADRLEAFVREARREGGVKAKVGDAFAEDPSFLRKLKPRLIAARARGARPVEPAPRAPAGPQLDAPPPPAKSGGPSPWLVLGAAFAAGFAVAKVIDWRGHAHPRR